MASGLAKEHPEVKSICIAKASTVIRFFADKDRMNDLGIPRCWISNDSISIETVWRITRHPPGFKQLRVLCEEIRKTVVLPLIYTAASRTSPRKSGGSGGISLPTFSHCDLNEVRIVIVRG